MARIYNILLYISIGLALAPGDIFACSSELYSEVKMICESDDLCDQSSICCAGHSSDKNGSGHCGGNCHNCQCLSILNVFMPSAPLLRNIIYSVNEAFSKSPFFLLSIFYSIWKPPKIN